MPITTEELELISEARVYSSIFIGFSDAYRSPQAILAEARGGNLMLGARGLKPTHEQDEEILAEALDDICELLGYDGVDAYYQDMDTGGVRLRIKQKHQELSAPQE